MRSIELVYIGREGQSVWIDAQTPVGTLYLRQDTAGHLYARLMGPRLETKVFDRQLKQLSDVCAHELTRALQDDSVIGANGSCLFREFADACATKQARMIRAQQRAIEAYLRCSSHDERNSILALLCFAIERAVLSSHGNKQGT